MIIYPNKKDEANNNPYHLTAKAPIRNISGLTSQGTISKCIIYILILVSKVENNIIDGYLQTVITKSK
jgi:hypothetical protein